ncbi:MAG: prolyl oligopeptidase family serine peptidase [Saprospiraceae bacterium]|nr:prolyl oligopeptidase family serine peptidase [Saprospiraceae bacterium]
MLAQERFEGWLDDDHFLMSQVEGTRELFVRVSLPGGQRSVWKDARMEKPYFSHPLHLGNGSMIQYQKQDLYLVMPDGSEQQLTQDSSEEKNARLAFDKKTIAYTKDHDLYVYDIKKNIERRLTYDGSETVYNGWASWVYYEEILGRSSNHAAFWWSPDSRKLAFLRFDDAAVPEFRLLRSSGQHGDMELMYYPKAGDTNPNVQFIIVDVETGSLTRIEEDSLKDQYSAFPFWTPDSKHLLFQELNRSQDTLHIVCADPNTGTRKIIYKETQNTWVDFIEEITFLNQNSFVFRSNRSGWYNLYSMDLEGALTHLTPVPWGVLEISEIDLGHQQIYFYATGPIATDRHFFSVGINGQNLRQITSEPGWHQVKPSPNKSYFHDLYSTLNKVETSQILDGKGKPIFIFDAVEEDINKLAGVTVESLSIKTEDGFTLPGFWVLPKGFDPRHKYPVVFTVYGGPDAGRVLNFYQNFSADFYANHDIISITMDNRGSGKFGKKGMDYMHRSLGKWEIDDLISAVKWLRTLPFIDSTQIGITGSSYGGYVTCMALTNGADFFTHGVSLYPVTDWRLYDNVYTERYMDLPKENPEGYQMGSAIEQAYKLKGKLLIIHGMMDDNVHMQNTMQLVSRLQDLGKDFEMMMYPGERHGWGGAKRSHLSRLTQNFWKKHFRVIEHANLRP